MRSQLRYHVYGLSALGLALALIIGACDSSTAPGLEDDAVVLANEAGTQLTLMLTDDPGELSQAWVEITGIYLQVGDHEQLGPQYGNGDGEGDGERVPLLEDAAEWVNLLTLAEDWTTLVEGAEIPVGAYAQLRFIVEGAAIVTADDGEVYATSLADLASLNAYLTEEELDPLAAATGLLRCPSCSRTGFKVRFPGGGLVLESGDNIVLIDFDVAETFGHEAGWSGRWIMHPTLRATDFPGGGTISGTVSLAEGLTELGACGTGDERPITFEDFVPTAERFGGPLRQADVDENGDYTIEMLPAGLYSMGYLAEVDVDVGGTTWTITFAATHPDQVGVAVGATATANYEIEEVGCAVNDG
jgi:hypothetical protein